MRIFSIFLVILWFSEVSVAGDCQVKALSYQKVLVGVPRATGGKLANVYTNTLKQALTETNIASKMKADMLCIGILHKVQQLVGNLNDMHQKGKTLGTNVVTLP